MPPKAVTQQCRFEPPKELPMRRFRVLRNSASLTATELRMFGKYPIRGRTFEPVSEPLGTLYWNRVWASRLPPRSSGVHFVFGDACFCADVL